MSADQFQLSCPVCKLPLTGDNKRLECDNRHSYDAAKQGYWNLLLANQKRSKDPGDNAEMVQARRSFLELNYYRQLADTVARKTTTLTRSIENPRILDMGCGEGYYTQKMQQQLSDSNPQAQLAGLDISKHAVKAACRQDKSILWLVASGANIPVADHSLDLVSLLFCRLMPEELSRTIKSGGDLLIAYPGEQHLIELRELIYDQVRNSGFNPAQALGDNFSLQDTETINYRFTLPDQQQIQQLVAMTPHGWRIGQAAKDKLAQLDRLELTLDVQLARFSRR